MSPGTANSAGWTGTDSEVAPSTHGLEDLRLAIVNDYEVIVAGVRSMLRPYLAQDVVELDVDAAPSEPVDIALLDTYGQPGLGIDTLRSLVASPKVGAAVVYSWTMSELARAQAFEAGARGLIAKSLPAAEVVAALRAVADGRIVDTRAPSRAPAVWPGADWGLTSRESEVVALLSTGASNRSIAASLYVSENTVRTHLKSIFKKVGVTSRSQLVARALGDTAFASRIVSPPPIKRQGGAQ